MNALAMISNINKWIYRHFVFLYFLLAVVGYSAVYVNRYAECPIRSDGLGYYSYLPALFIHHDAGMKKVYRFVHKRAPCLYPGLNPKRYFDKYPMGEAVMMVPFFLLADLLTLLFRNERDGFSAFYQHAAGLSGVAYSALGIYFLRKILTKYFADGISLAVLVSITFGTDLFHYGTYDSIFSHAYSFFLFCAFFYYIPGWIEKPDRRRSTVLGLIFGMICLTRNPNALILIYASLFVLCILPDCRARLDFVGCNYKNIMRIGIVSILVFIPQLCYWKFATGKWLVDSYGSQGEHFNFLSPHLLDVLLSFRKGLFIWSPILLLSVIGLARMKGSIKTQLIPSVAFLCANTYVIASWGCWSYGGSFSHRGFVESLGLFAIALGSFYASLQSKLVKIAAGALSSLLIIYSIMGMFGYWIRIVPFDESTSATILGLFTSSSMAVAAVAFLLTLPFWLLPILYATPDQSTKTSKITVQTV